MYDESHKYWSMNSVICLKRRGIKGKLLDNWKSKLLPCSGYSIPCTERLTPHAVKQWFLSDAILLKILKIDNFHSWFLHSWFQASFVDDKTPNIHERNTENSRLSVKINSIHKNKLYNYSFVFEEEEYKACDGLQKTGASNCTYNSADTCSSICNISTESLNADDTQVLTDSTSDYEHGGWELYNSPCRNFTSVTTFESYSHHVCEETYHPFTEPTLSVFVHGHTPCTFKENYVITTECQTPTPEKYQFKKNAFVYAFPTIDRGGNNNGSSNESDDDSSEGDDRGDADTTLLSHVNTSLQHTLPTHKQPPAAHSGFSSVPPTFNSHRSDRLREVKVPPPQQHVAITPNLSTKSPGAGIYATTTTDLNLTDGYNERGPILLDIPNGRNELVMDAHSTQEVPKLYPIVGLRKEMPGIALPPPIPLYLPIIGGNKKTRNVTIQCQGVQQSERLQQGAVPETVPIDRPQTSVNHFTMPQQQFADHHNNYKTALGHAIYGSDLQGQGRACGNIGNIHMSLKEPVKAVHHYIETLRLSTDRSTKVTGYHNRGYARYDVAKFRREGKKPKELVPATTSDSVYKIFSIKLTDEVINTHPVQESQLDKDRSAKSVSEHEEYGMPNATKIKQCFIFNIDILVPISQPVTVSGRTFDYMTSEEINKLMEVLSFYETTIADLLEAIEAREQSVRIIKDFHEALSISLSLFGSNSRSFYKTLFELGKVYHPLSEFGVMDVISAEQASGYDKQARTRALRKLVLQKKKAYYKDCWKFFGDRFRIKIIPSVLSFTVMSKTSDPIVELPEEKSDFLIVSDSTIPAFVHDTVQWNLGRLPFAEKEALNVASILGTTPVLREQAIKQSVLYQLRSAKITHLATHGSASTEFLGFTSTPKSGVAETEHILIFPHEIETPNISPALVVLSSYDSRRGQVKAVGVIGMARAFLSAGVHSMLVSLWRVSVESANVFMQYLYQFLYNGILSFQAQKRSMQHLRCFRKYSHFKYMFHEKCTKVDSIHQWFDNKIENARVSQEFGEQAKCKKFVEDSYRGLKPPKNASTSSSSVQENHNILVQNDEITENSVEGAAYVTNASTDNISTLATENIETAEPVQESTCVGDVQSISLPEKIERDFLSYFKARYSNEYTLVEIKKEVLQLNRVLVFVSCDRVWVLVPNEGKVKIMNVVLQEVEIEKAISHLHQTLSSCETLDKMLVKPLIECMGENVKVSFIPDNKTYFIPFDFIMNKDKLEPFGVKYSINTPLSFRTIREMNLTSDPVVELPGVKPDFLIVGNPTIPQFMHKSYSLSFVELPFAEKEAKDVASIIGGEPLLRDKATKQEFLYRLKSAKIVHVAAHGSAEFLPFAPSHPPTSGVAKAEDILLFPHEIEALSISPALVVLSSCYSGLGPVEAERVIGWARAFISAGAHSVVVCLRRVYDKCAHKIMQYFYRSLVNGLPSSDALQKAMVYMRHYHEYDQWSGFCIFGRDIMIHKSSHRLLGRTSLSRRQSVIAMRDNLFSCKGSSFSKTQVCFFLFVCSVAVVNNLLENRSL